MTTEKIPLTYDQALTALQEVVAERGRDYVYPYPTGECTYVKGGEPSCIVGHVLHRRGLSLRLLSAWNDSPAFLVAHKFMDTDERTRELLQTVQEKQDLGKPWGLALSDAIFSANRIGCGPR